MLLFDIRITDIRRLYEQRRAALRQKQDSSLLAAQQELAIVDSALQIIKAEYEKKKNDMCHKGWQYGV